MTKQSAMAVEKRRAALYEKLARALPGMPDRFLMRDLLAAAGVESKTYNRWVTARVLEESLKCRMCGYSSTDRQWRKT